MPHRSQRRQLLSPLAAEIEFGIHRQVSGLEPTGDGWGRGFFLHSSLLVGADSEEVIGLSGQSASIGMAIMDQAIESEEVIGLSGQKLFYRQRRNKKESRHDRVLRKRESEVWGRVIDEVGAPPPEVRFTHLFDQGADNFESPIAAPCFVTGKSHAKAQRREEVLMGMSSAMEHAKVPFAP